MPYKIVFEKAKEIERLLRDELEYEGRGIHELVTDAGGSLPTDVARACRKVATIRNKLAHQAGYSVEGKELESFNQAAHFASEGLQNIVDEKAARSAPRESSSSSPSGDTDDLLSWKTAAKIAGAVAALAAIALFGNR